MLSKGIARSQREEKNESTARVGRDLKGKKLGCLERGGSNETARLGQKLKSEEEE